MISHRAVVVQHLGLSQAQKDSLFLYLTWNAQPENRTYRYDFLYDNCATRIRDALERIIDLPLAGDEPYELTFRDAVKPYARDNPLIDLGMNLGMGLPADIVPTRRDLAFLPLDLAAITAEARLPSGLPLVSQTDTLYGSPAPPQRRTSLPWTAAVFWLALGWGVYLTVMNYKKPRRGLTDLILFSIVGVMGLVVAFLSLISLHDVTWPNLHLLWAWPFHSAIIWIRRPWTRYYWWASGFAGLVFLVGLPFWTQGIPGDIVPLVLLLTLRSVYLGLVPRTGFEPVLPA